MAGLYDRTLLALCQESTGDTRGLFQAPDTRGSRHDWAPERSQL
jgi:hypothetical protein